MIIAQISDTHIALDSADAAQRIRDFESTIADINTLDPAPDVIVHTGDIVHTGRREEYACAAAILANARVPVYVMAGNKDDRANLRERFAGRGYLSPDARFVQYAIEDYPVRLIALDTLSSASNKGDFCRERIKHFIDMIDADTGRPAAVFTHHPPFEVMVGPDRIHFDSLDAMSALRRTIQHSGRVAAVFSGHVHRAAAGHVGNIPATVVQCIATILRRGEYPPAMKGRPVYHIHRFEPDGGFISETRIVAAVPQENSAREPIPARRAGVR
jgi:3',5'-cyclic-AMP phosphodiesterase